MMNMVAQMGRLTRDPELRRTPNGTAVTSFSIAVERDYASGGEKQTDFFDVVCWRQTAEFVAKHFNKGRMITVVGKLQSRKWSDKEGKNHTAVEIVADNVYFCDSKAPAAANAGVAPAYGSAPAYGAAPVYGAESGYAAPNPAGDLPYGYMAPEDDEAQLPY